MRSTEAETERRRGSDRTIWQRWSLRRVDESAGMGVDMGQRPNWRSLAGLIAYSLATILLSGLLLTVNAGLLYPLFLAASPLLPPMVALPQVGQLFLFLGAFSLLVLEWILWDSLFGRRFNR
jgi:hypothetical protein